VLGHDELTGELTQVRWNNDDRSVMSHLEPGLVEDWYVCFWCCPSAWRCSSLLHGDRYSAIRAWNQCLTSPDSEFWFQLQPGTAVSASYIFLKRSLASSV
jgi:trimethyllysine dioxygenase